MIIELKETKKSPEAKVGDAVVTKCGHIVVVASHHDYTDNVRGFNLNNLEYTDCYSNMDYLIREIEGLYGNVERVIKSDNLKVVEV